MNSYAAMVLRQLLMDAEDGRVTLEELYIYPNSSGKVTVSVDAVLKSLVTPLPEVFEFSTHTKDADNG